MMVKPKRKTIAITGARGLIGSAIVRSLSKRHQIVTIEGRLPNIDLIIKQIADSDVFINNAMHKWGQIDLLIQLYNYWRSKDKLIINIGSRAASPNVSRGFEYSTAKASINHFCDLVRFKDGGKSCRLTTINPGLVGKEREYSLEPSYIADLISWLVSQPDFIEISRIDLSHIAPYERVQQTKLVNSRP